MTAWDWVVLFGSCALIALVGYCCARDGAKDDDRNAWQESTALRTEDDVRRDIAAKKTADEIAWLYEKWPDPPRGTKQIPHQTRRTEEDQ
ncbi:hypothetical protein [Streptomyces sp. NPDC056387]|uniref:hypothetical protein n=1 Tax=Streptomyces sp. NPDC056387 TaxID=3345803 RepID=UPI0035DD6DE4